VTKKFLIIFSLGICLFVPLKIQATGNLQLISPNGNEEWKVEQNYEICWQADPIIEKISLVLYRNRQLIGVIARNIPASDAKITWTPGFEFTENDNYRIGVYEYPFSQGKLVDYSDAPFTVKKDTLSTIIETNFDLGVDSNHIPPESVLYFNPEKNSGWFYVAQTIPENNLSFWAAAVRSLSTQPDDNTAQLLYGITDTSTGEHYSGMIENGLFSENAEEINLYYEKDGRELLRFNQIGNDYSEFELKVYLPLVIGQPETFQLQKTLTFSRPILFESGDGVIPISPDMDSLYVSLALDQGFWVDFQKFNLDPDQIFFRPANHRWMSFILDKSIGPLKAGTVGLGWEILDENNQRQPGGYTNIDLLIPGDPQMTASQKQIDKVEIIELEYWQSPYKKYLKKWKIIYPGVELLFETLAPNQESNLANRFYFYEGQIKVFNPQTGEQIGTGMLEQTHDETSN